MMMHKDDVIRYFGSVSKSAKALGISKQAVSKWPETVPPVRQYHIELITGGALKADRRVASE